MRTHQSYDLAQGSVIGRDHRAVPKNCQDGAYTARSDLCTVGIVTDGCGSSTHSEVGAQLGARFLVQTLLQEVAITGNVSGVRWSRIRQDLLAQLHTLAKSMHGSFSQIVNEFFLFSIVGFIMDADEAIFFSIGDGVVIINGQVTILEPMEGNRPSYIAYGLVETSIEKEQPGALEFKEVGRVPLAELENFIIGCDGVVDLLRQATSNLPGMSKPVGYASQFWEEDRFFKNPDLVSRQLRLIARDWPKRDPQPGLLPDDTTMIVGRARPELPSTERTIASDWQSFT